jgi:catalase (peroxidase I)
VQYVRAADAGTPPSEDTVFRLPADYALKEADVFRRWALLYARDEGLFSRDFQRTYQRVMQVGLSVCHLC